ncbi:MAG TPA: alpha/beta hydrolase [Verrucomicrobiae bacterium]|jgi:pimeloyl-ACP methyl ester carboxylesterase|nr:alpha/beta hydrolase [Verrucomicrobiae bacterium]
MKGKTPRGRTMGAHMISVCGLVALLLGVTTLPLPAQTGDSGRSLIRASSAERDRSAQQAELRSGWEEGEIGDGFKSGYQTVGAIKLHYVAGGEGRPVLLVPGWPETWYAWRKVMPALARNRRVIAVDTRGMGGSGRPVGGYDMASTAADLHGLMNQLGYRQYAVVGHDIGMWIGYALAADFPHDVDRLAVIEAMIPGLTPTPPLFLPPEQNLRRWHFMFNQLPDLPEALIAGRERVFLSWLFEHYAYRPDMVAIDEYIRAYSVPGAMRAGFEYYRAIPETMAQNKKRAETKLEMPVLAIGGDHANGLTPKQTMEPVATKLSGGVLPECGHFAPEECPDALLELLLPFLSN